MERDQTTLASFYRGWGGYQAMLVDAIAPLSTEQLALRVGPSLWPVWQLAAHIVAARVHWFQGWMGEGEAGLADLDQWDDDGAPPRTAADLTDGLERTWRMIDECLERWTPAMLDDRFERRRGGTTETETRRWIVWHVIEHDLHHGGELFLTLGSHGVATPEM
jgi:uncharacterized damage-inducible protein DinB